MFTWSSSGTIITEALASSCPTVVVFVIDTVRSATPIAFISNMLFACSVLQKIRLPYIVVMNKVIYFICYAIYYYFVPLRLCD